MTAESNHPVFEAPKNPNTKIWRYMDFTKYVAFLASKALFFSRSDKFDDPYEGTTSRLNIKNRPEVYKNIPEQNRTEIFNQMSNANKSFREWTFINCWHMNENESAAMWKLYAYSNEAIAIQSTYQKLFDCLPSKTYVGVVKYIDYEKDWLPEGNTFYPFIHKRLSFIHEQELRAVIQEIKPGVPNFESGRLIKVNIKKLVEKVYIAPTAPSWFSNLAKSVTQKYGFDVVVNSSSLDTAPVF
jgi:hypothetical protein